MKSQLEFEEGLTREFLSDLENVVTDPSQLLLILNTIAKQEPLELNELMLLSQAGTSAYNLRYFFEEAKPSSPRAVVDVDRIDANLIQQRIEQLQESGVRPGDLPEITPKNMDSFLSKMSNYLLESAALPTVAEILEARKDSKNARLLARIPNVIIDNIFRAIAVDGGWANLPMEMYNRVSQGVSSNVIADAVSKLSGIDRGSFSVPAYLFVSGISKDGGLSRAILSSGAAYLGHEKLGLNAQDAEILGCLIAGGATSATKELINQQLYASLEGPKALKDLNFSGAKESFWLSRQMADTAVTCFSKASEVLAGVLGQGVSSAIGGATGEMAGALTEEAVKVTASMALLGTLVVLKNYLSQDTAGKTKNPELVESTIKDISTAADRVSSDLQVVAKSVEMPYEEKQWGITEADLDSNVKKAALEAAEPIRAIIKQNGKQKPIDYVKISTVTRSR